MEHIIENIAFELGIGIPIIIIGIIIFYLMPIIVASCFMKVKTGLFLATIFFGRTPFPYIILLMDMIEEAHIDTRKEIETLRKELNVYKISK